MSYPRWPRGHCCHPRPPWTHCLSSPNSRSEYRGRTPTLLSRARTAARLSRAKGGDRRTPKVVLALFTISCILPLGGRSDAGAQLLGLCRRQRAMWLAVRRDDQRPDPPGLASTKTRRSTATAVSEGPTGWSGTSPTATSIRPSFARSGSSDGDGHGSLP